jgi:hypothetical protein
VAKSLIGTRCSKKIGNGPSSLGRFSQIWLYEIQNLNHPVMFFGYKLKTKYINQPIFPSFFFPPPSLLAIDNLQNHSFFHLKKIYLFFSLVWQTFAIKKKG